MTDERTIQYSTVSTLLIVSLVFFPRLVQAQDCEPAKQRMYQIEIHSQHIPDSLQTLLDLATFVRDCEGDVALEIELWLLNNEVFALNGLERHEQAREKVDHFFTNYLDEKNTSDFYRAKFYLWRLHLSALNGIDSDMIRDYTEAQKYNYALDPPHRASLLVDGAYAYHHIMQYETALLLIEQAQDLLGTPETSEEQRVMARALLIAAEAELWLSRNLPQVKEQLIRAASLYGALGDTSKVAIATTLIGLAQAAEGDTTAALAQMDQAVQIARQSGSIRSHIFSRWRYGQLLRKWGNLETAESLLLEALNPAETYQEYYLDIVYELALLYDECKELEEAIRFYRAVVDAPRPTRYADAIKAERKAHIAENRLLLFASERQHTRDRTALTALMFILLVIGFVFLFRRRRRSPSPTEYGKGGFYLPYEMPTGLTLSELKARFLTMPEASELVARRLAYAYAILFDRALIRAFITDDYLQPQVEEDRLKDNTTLFLCIAQIETSVDNQIFSGRPNNSIRAHLNGAFGKYGWPWPAYPMDWKRYFMKYHMDLLFGITSRNAPEAQENE